MSSIVNKLKKLVKNLINKMGFRTNRHIVVFESDDWGAVRNSSKEDFAKLKAQYPEAKFDYYQSLDQIESNADVEDLSKVLLNHKDSKGNYAKFTLNYVTANPDFEKIKADGLKEIYYEDFLTTYARSSEANNVFNLVKHGTEIGIFKPQLHSREHFNSRFLLADLQQNQFVRDAFNLGIIGVLNETYCALDTLNNDDNEQLLIQAQGNFQRAFGYKSKTFVAPCYVWSLKDEFVFAKLGIQSVQTKMSQNWPRGRDNYKRVFHKFGDKNKKSGIIYTIRNCFFEPSKDAWGGVEYNDEDVLKRILNEVESAFKSKKPAVICSHRVNYVSGMSQDNKMHNLELLDKLLTSLEQRYDNLEYLSSDELLETMRRK